MPLVCLFSVTFDVTTDASFEVSFVISLDDSDTSSDIYLRCGGRPIFRVASNSFE